MKSAIPNNGGGTFQPLRHRSGTMRDRLHGYTKRTLGAGGSVTEAVSYFFLLFTVMCFMKNCIIGEVNVFCAFVFQIVPKDSSHTF